VIKICEDPKTYNHFIAQDIDFDGLVIKLHQFDLRERLGSTDHHPRWAMAYKFPAQQIATQVEKIDRQV
jgi:DNA ligase (NAD+)